MLVNILLPLFAFILSISSIPIIIIICDRFEHYDAPNERKIHTKKISRLGGVAIFLSFFPVVSYILINYEFKFNIYLYLLAVLIIFSMGFIDDLRYISARYKLLVQIISASIVVVSGLYIQEIPFFGGIKINFFPITSVFTVFVIVLFINAINLIDGTDGLASGVVMIALFFTFIISIVSGKYNVALISLSLIGSIMGFYIFNFPPAKIFMGDGGAYLLGFMYATISLMGIKKTSAFTVFLIPIILILVPLSDFAYVIFKRMKLGYHIFTADKNHLHHRLLDIGMGYKGILFIIYGGTIFLGLSSIMMLYIDIHKSYILFFILIVAVIVAAYTLKTIEEKINEERIKIEKINDKLEAHLKKTESSKSGEKKLRIVSK